MVKSKYNLFTIIVLFCIVGVGVLASLVFTQNLYTDELNYYLPAARQIANGKLLYQDFFFPQMPLSAISFLPFSGGGWTRFFLARALSSLLALISGIILIIYSFHRSKSKTVSTYIGILWLGNAVLIYNSIQATQRSWVNLLNILFLLLFLLSMKRRNAVLILLSGICIGLSTSFRLIFFILLFIAAIILLLKRGWKSVFYLTVGFLIGFLPSIYYFIKSPNHFLFCNLLYHFNRATPSFYWLISYRLLILGKVLFFPTNILLFGLLAAFIKWRELRTEEWLSLICAVAMFIFFYLILTPTHFSYMTEIYPFLLFLLVPRIGFLKGKRWSKWLLIFYISSYIPCSLIYSFTIREWQKSHTISNMKKVTEAIKRNTSQSDIVASFGFYYGFLPDREDIPEIAIPTYDVSENVPENLREKYHLTSYQDIPQILQRHKPRLIVDDFTESDVKFFRLKELGYRKIGDYSGISLFLLDGKRSISE